MDREDHVARAVVQQWQAAGKALAEVWARELRALSDQEALAAADALLWLVDQLPAKESECGLVEQQRLFARARP
ncbi:MAG: hypothetical protein ACRDZ4_09580 [Egibacteraceae bacterium]